MDTPIKAGWQTTEFYYTLLSNVIGIVTLFAPSVHLTDQIVHTVAGILLMVVTNAVYIFSRGKVKASTTTSVTSSPNSTVTVTPK